MQISYQLVISGSPHPLQQQVEDTFLLRTAELGLDSSVLKIIRSADFSSVYRSNAPTFCIYFGDAAGNYTDTAIAVELKADGKLVVPVATDLTLFSTQIPPELRDINGFELNGPGQVEALVSLVLEGLSLLRLSRRLFISYKRDESSAVAIQLFERMEKAGFDVFLDTHSIRPGEPFQEELWQRLADTDVVVLLNTPNFLVSNWTKEELARANGMSIGILQLVWPAYTPERYAELTISEPLSVNDFEMSIYNTPRSSLATEALDRVVGLAESLRARSLAARQTNMINEFMAAAETAGVKTSLQPGRFLLADRRDGRQLVIIPTVGVPQAFTYHQSEELVKTIRTNDIAAVYLLYDHLNIRDKWVKHLDWLDEYLVVKSIKLLEVEKKLPTLI